MHRSLSRPAAAFTVAVALSLSATAAGPVDPARFLAHVRFLASDELKGRGNGSSGLENAADYIGDQMRRIGLEPGGDAGTFFQRLDVITGVKIGRENTLAVAGPNGRVQLSLGRDYFPLATGADSAKPAAAPATLPLVFAGYGISSAAHKYDDYDGLGVNGKAVLILTHEPQENDASSRFDGKANTTHATELTKAMVAKHLGARMVILVEDPTHGAERTNYGAFLKDPQIEDYGVAFVRVTRQQAARALAGVLDLEQAAREIDRDLTPRSRAIEGVQVSFSESYSKVHSTVRNVIGVLRGSDTALAGEAVVVGAHYDHLGTSGRHSLARDAGGQIHNGADDNASGTAALLEIARNAVSDRKQFSRSVVFVAFAAEEIGLIGSSAYVNRPTIPIERTVAMLNLDMIGRPNGRILISGLDTAPGLEADVTAAAAGLPLQVRQFKEGAGVGASDDTSFSLRRVPALAFFSGFHDDYHRPTDDWMKIDGPGGAAVATLALNLASRISRRPDRVAFVGKPASAPSASGQATGGGYGPYFGSVPDFAESDSPGVRMAEVREDSPAGKAGFRRGDVLVSFDGAPMKNIYDFTFALRNKRPGDSVEVVMLREGKEVKAIVELTNRP
jgi:Zn-dependent M28 family amino/carboxypeptidase